MLRIVVTAGLLFALVAASPASAARIYVSGSPMSDRTVLVITTSQDGRSLTRLGYRFVVRCTTLIEAHWSGTADRARGDQPARLASRRQPRGTLGGTLEGVRRVDDGTIETIAAELTGTIRDRSARGRLDLRVTRVDATTGAVVHRCAETRFWTARRDPGRIYAGATSQGQPMMLELVPSRTRLRRGYITWIESCDFPVATGWSWMTITQSWPLKRGGSFTRTTAGRLAGRFRGGRATGTFHYASTDEETNHSCTTGDLTWTLRTG